MAVLRWSVRALLCGAVVITAVQAQSSPQCAELIEKPAYTRLARIAAIQGSLRVHFEVDANGRPNHVTHEGNGIFAASVDSALGQTTLPANCNKTFDLVYQFVLGGKEEDEAHTFVVSSTRPTNTL